MPGQRPAVQRDAVPGDALHVRHPGIVIEGRVVVLVLLDDGEDASRRLASFGTGREPAEYKDIARNKGQLIGWEWITARQKDRATRRSRAVARPHRRAGPRGSTRLGKSAPPNPPPPAPSAASRQSKLTRWSPDRTPTSATNASNEPPPWWPSAKRTIPQFSV